MQSNYNISLQELNSRVSVMQLAIAFGYQEYRPKSYRNGKAMVLGTPGDFIDQILISPSRNRPGQQHFQNFKDEHDGGNSAAIFVERYISKGIIPDPLPDDSLWQNKAKAVLCNYLNMPVDILKTIEIPPVMKDIPFDENTAKVLLIYIIHPYYQWQGGALRLAFCRTRDRQRR